MSDSDEGAFESADEGEKEELQKAKSKKTRKVEKPKDEENAKAETMTADDTSKSDNSQKVSGENNSKNEDKNLQEDSKTFSSQEKAQASSCDKTEASLDDAASTTDLVKEKDATVESVIARTSEVSVSKDSSKDTNVVTEQPVQPTIDRAGGEGDQAAGSQEDRDRQVLDKLASAADKSSGGWGWAGWGSSLINTATSSVATFTSSVGEGVKSVMETVETSLGAIDPEELASQQIAAETEEETKISRGDEAKSDYDKDGEKSEEDVDSSQGGSKTEEGASQEEEGGWLNWGSKATSWGMTSISGITEMAKETSKKMVSGGEKLVVGGLDVLETIGKKTYEVVAEGDHGLKQTLRNRGNKPNLSQALREASAQAQQRAKEEEEFVEERKAHYGAMFEEYQGLVQLEALEMLSGQCDGRVQSLLTSLDTEAGTSLKPEMTSIQQAFSVDELDDQIEDIDEQDFRTEMTDLVGQLGINTTPDKIIQVQEKTKQWLDDFKTEPEGEEGEKPEAKVVHQQAIQSLAELTARAMDLFHRIGQLLLVEDKAPVTAYKNKAQQLYSITKVICIEIGIISTKFTTCLNAFTKEEGDSEETKAINSMVTTVYLEASNSSTYIQDAFQLLQPVVQQAVVEAYSSTT